MEQTIAKAPETVEESETTSLLAERAAVKSDRQEIKGRMYDLQFDNLSEADSQAAKDKIIQDHKDIEDRYESHVNMVKDEIAKEKAAIVAIKKEYDEKAAAIIKTETNPSKEEGDKAKTLYDSNVAKENESFNSQLNVLNGEIAKIHTQAKETDKKLRAEYASVKKVPMKRADKVTKLDALKSEIYKNSGNADLEILERKNSIKTLKSKHKTTMDKYSNDLHLETDRVATLVKNIRNEEKAKLAPHKEKLDELRKNYKPVAPIYERVGLGVSFWAREWVAKQRKSFSSWRNFSDWFVHNAVYLIILAMVIFTGIKKPSWVSFPSLINILKHTSALLPLALGVAGTIVLTGTDLSLGKIWCFTALLAAVLLAYSGPDGGIIIKWTQNMPWIWIIVVLIVVLVAGGLFGAVNGFFVAQFSIHPFVVTLATQLIINGAILLFADQLKFSVTYSSNLGIANSYNDFVSGGFYIGNTLIEWYNIFAIILIIATWFIWNKTKFGKAMFAVGCNPDAANVSGINVNRTILWTFILAGIMYGFGGFIYNPINGGAQLTTGTGGELDPITAAVIGGVSFTGGIGKVSGVFIGCVLLKVIDSCLTAIGAQPAWVNIAKGAIILFAVALDMKKYIVKK